MINYIPYVNVHVIKIAICKTDRRMYDITKIKLWNNIINTLRPRQNGRNFVDDILKCIFLNENVWIPITFSKKFVPNGPINNIPALV